MAIKFGRRVIVNGIACVVSAVIFDFLLNKKIWFGIKKKFVDFKDYTKHVTAEGVQAYKKGRDSIAQYRRDKTPPLPPDSDPCLAGRQASSAEKVSGGSTCAREGIPVDKYTGDDLEGPLKKRG